MKHDGVIYKGEREVIEYDGLTATPDHPVWIEGKKGPVHLGFAASIKAHLIQTGDGGKAIRLGKDHISRTTVERQDEHLLCSDPMHGMWFDIILAERLKKMFFRASGLITFSERRQKSAIFQ